MNASKDNSNLKKGEKSYVSKVVNQIKSECEPIIAEIDSYRQKLLIGSKDEGSIESQVQKTVAEIKAMHTSAIELNETISDTDLNGNTVYDKIEKFKEEFDEKLNEVEDLIERIENYDLKLFGGKDQNGVEIEGIKESIENELDKLENLHINSTKRQNELFNKIEGLLKGASTVALAKAFQEHKKSYKWHNLGWFLTFLFSILGMMAFTVWSQYQASYNLSELWKYTIRNLPFLGGAIWLALYSSKQRSQNKRLQEEYAFKEDVSKIYYGLKEEINELGDTDIGKELKEKILGIIVTVVSANPSKTLEHTSHNDKGPILESLESVKSLINKNNPT